MKVNGKKMMQSLVLTGALAITGNAIAAQSEVKIDKTDVCFSAVKAFGNALKEAYWGYYYVGATIEGEADSRSYHLKLQDKNSDNFMYFNLELSNDSVEMCMFEGLEMDLGEKQYKRD